MTRTIRSATYTHLGYRPQTGYVHRSSSQRYGGLAGHGDYRGKVHALRGPARPYEGATYTTVCGKSLRCEDDGMTLCVWRAQMESRPTCAACLRRNPALIPMPTRTVYVVMVEREDGIGSYASDSNQRWAEDLADRIAVDGGTYCGSHFTAVSRVWVEERQDEI